VGAIADINEIDASVFHFIHDGVRTSAAQRQFQLGDTPIDGLIMARVLDQATLNFVPEAKLTGNNNFFDNDNRI
jgi:hypothetical protein